MRVLGYDPHVRPTRFAQAGVEHCADLSALLAASDFVSVHAVLNAETRDLIGARELAAMKPSAFLVNVSRGAIVDEAALLRRLQESGSRARRSTSTGRSRWRRPGIR